MWTRSSPLARTCRFLEEGSPCSPLQASSACSPPPSPNGGTPRASIPQSASTPEGAVARGRPPVSTRELSAPAPPRRGASSAPHTFLNAQMVELPDGTKLPALADGEYDAIVLGTGLKECIISGDPLSLDPEPLTLRVST